MQPNPEEERWVQALICRDNVTGRSERDCAKYSDLTWRTGQADVAGPSFGYSLVGHTEASMEMTQGPR